MEIGERIMTFIITLFQDEDGVFIAECPSIPGCVSQGKTESEAEANIREAIKECLEVRAEKGMPLTVSTRQIEVAV
jgi:predicted RNase H-like HicB family nuclease